MRISDWSSDVCSSDLFALTLHQREHSLFPGNVLTFVGIARLAADVGFIGLDNLIPAADGTALWVNGAFPQAVEEEPRGFIVGAEHALELKGAHALLAGGHELSGQHPLGQLDLAALHDGADSHGEGLAAFFALMHARTGGLALELGNAVGVGIATVRADGAVRPQQAL